MHAGFREGARRARLWVAEATRLFRSATRRAELMAASFLDGDSRTKNELTQYF